MTDAARLDWERPEALWLGGLAALALLVGWGLLARRHGRPPGQVILLGSLRLIGFAPIVLLLARPVWSTDAEAERRESAVVLVDRSGSMALRDFAGGPSRLDQARSVLRERLLPALGRAGLGSAAVLFADEAHPADGPELARANPDGPKTDVGRGLIAALDAAQPAPAAVILLSDGVDTERSALGPAIGELIRRGVPLLAVGLGSEVGARTLTLRQALAPPTAAVGERFAIAAQLETTGSGPMPGFDLVLSRDGRLLERKTIEPGNGPRTWLVAFDRVEDEPGTGRYAVRLQFPPATEADIKTISDRADVSVRIADEGQIRVLFAQGGLTWDYKFIRLAVSGDPKIAFSGLSRTSERSYLVQDEQSDLTAGFPEKVEGLAPYRVIILSNVRASDLRPAQQEALARHCGELGGGLLLIGGERTFDRSWRGTRLEQILPVRIDAGPGFGNDAPFALDLTPEALQHPVFRIDDQLGPAEIWNRLPPFAKPGRVAGVKPGAEVWATHPVERLAEGDRPLPLMAIQPYGAGLVMAVTIQNFWRWRLEKDSDPMHYDRFWRQLIRHLASGNREEVRIELPEQDLRPGRPVRALLTRRQRAEGAGGASTRAELLIDRDGTPVERRSLELPPGRALELSFATADPGIYTLTVRAPGGAVAAERSIDVKRTDVELIQSAPDFESLRAWAELTGGLAVRADQCDDADAVMKALRARARSAEARSRLRRTPAWLDGWMLAWALIPFCIEWALRKRWSLA